ncbi:MAG TPA: VOC family protein, partial [Methanobacterium sp.]|nr:VOC family protein [Methanobacterium sp.]
FKDSEVVSVTRYGAGGPIPEGTVMTAKFQIEGQEFVALNGGPQFKFTEAISFVVNCESQEEIDYYWDKFSKEGEEQGPGWVKDKYGLSWQIVPVILQELMGDEDPKKSGKVMGAMMQMTKIDINKLKEAYNG